MDIKLPTADEIILAAILQNEVKHVPKSILDVIKRMDYSEYNDWFKWTGCALEPELRDRCLRILNILQTHRINLEEE